MTVACEEKEPNVPKDGRAFLSKDSEFLQICLPGVFFISEFVFRCCLMRILVV